MMNSQQQLQNQVNGNGFYMQQLYTRNLSQFAYYIESQGQAVLIDPLKDVDSYLSLINQRQAKLKYILLTHFHADFLAGHLTLKQETNAKIIMGPSAEANFIDKMIKDSEEIDLGEIKIRALYTPGNTLESTCYLQLDRDYKPINLFTGDTLFLGEVGHPDQAVMSSELTIYDLAGLLYRSLHEKILTLPADVQIYPGHGEGSTCGKKIQSGFKCTVGKQTQTNYALQPMSQQQFIDIVTANLPDSPNHFFHNVTLNRGDEDQDLSKALLNLNKPLSAKEVKDHLDRGILIIDSRASISNGFISGSINISSTNNFDKLVSQLIQPQYQLIIVADPEMEDNTIMRLMRNGYVNILGYLNGGIKSWDFELTKLNEFNSKDFMVIQLKDQSQILLDVRNLEECQRGVINGAKNIPLFQLEQSLQELDKSKNINVYCGSGVRAKIAATILKKNGYDKVNICTGGYLDIDRDTYADNHRQSLIMTYKNMG